jgi:hypothetical protein
VRAKEIVRRFDEPVRRWFARRVTDVAVRRLFDIAHPTTRRLYRSTMTKRYKHPSPVAI